MSNPKLYCSAFAPLAGIFFALAGASGCTNSTASPSESTAGKFSGGNQVIFCDHSGGGSGPLGLIIATIPSDTQQYRVTRGAVASACAGQGPLDSLDLSLKPNLAVDADFLDGIQTNLTQVALTAANAHEFARAAQLHFNGHVDGPFTLWVKVESWDATDKIAASMLAPFSRANALQIFYNAPLEADALAPLTNLADVLLAYPNRQTMTPDVYLPAIVQLKSTSVPNLTVHFGGKYVDRDYVTPFQSAFDSMYCHQFSDDSIFAPRRRVCSGTAL